MAVLIVGLFLFFGIHSVIFVAPDFRTQIIESRGAGFWKGSYSVISLIGFGLIIWGYILARDGSGQLFAPPSWGRTFAVAVIPISFILIQAANFGYGYIKHVVKHPMLWGTILWSLAHLLANGDVVSSILFAAFLIWSIVDLVFATRRSPAPAQTISIKADVISVVAGVLLTWLFVAFLHSWLIGVPLR